jgi:tRNA (cytidine/uridine-2'-O-)-methyltransferase
MNVVLIEPEIPPNTGNVARLCAATGAVLHLVGPLGFRLDDKELKRAGMDYWNEVEWKYWKAFDELKKNAPADASFYFVETSARRIYTQARYKWGDFLVFGRETKGLPREILEENRNNLIGIPMFNPKARSLNLSNCVAIVLYEAMRQVKGF